MPGKFISCASRKTKKQLHNYFPCCNHGKGNFEGNSTINIVLAALLITKNSSAL